MIFVTISEGQTPSTAKPILATNDERVVRGIGDLLAKLLLQGSKPPEKKKEGRINGIPD